MKTLTSILSIFLILAFFGCRESLVNQPEQSLNKGQNSAIKDEINFCCQASDPITGDCKVMGKVTYLHEILQYSAEANSVVPVRVNLEMDAELCTRLMNPRRYSIYGNSVDTVFLSEAGKILLDKTYGVQYRPDLRLCVQYLITTEGVGIMQMNLLQIVN